MSTKVVKKRLLKLKIGYITLLLSLMTGCKTEMPKVDIELWAGDSHRAGVTRSQEEKTIACNDEQMDEFVCLSYADLKKIYSTLLKCKKWGTEVSSENTKEFMDKNPDIHHNLFLKGQQAPTSLPEIKTNN